MTLKQSYGEFSVMVLFTFLNVQSADSNEYTAQVYSEPSQTSKVEL